MARPRHGPIDGATNGGPVLDQLEMDDFAPGEDAGAEVASRGHVVVDAWQVRFQ